jgi:hypothetical protein
MVAAPLKNEADCLGRQHRRTSGAANYLNLTRSAYRESGLVLWPLWKAFHNGHYGKIAVMTSARSAAVLAPMKAGLFELICFS